jgi:microcystin-dependent protein
VSVDPAWAPPSFPPGLVAGTESITLLNVELPLHTHVAQATTSPASTPTPPAGGFLAKAANSTSLYAPGGQGPVTLAQGTLANSGGSQPHPNVQPTLAINFNIATSGVYPSRS